jgi:hypothetical protein
VIAKIVLVVFITIVLTLGVLTFIYPHAGWLTEEESMPKYYIAGFWLLYIF